MAFSSEASRTRGLAAFGSTENMRGGRRGARPAGMAGRSQCERKQAAASIPGWRGSSRRRITRTLATRTHGSRRWSYVHARKPETAVGTPNDLQRLAVVQAAATEGRRSRPSTVSGAGRGPGRSSSRTQSHQSPSSRHAILARLRSPSYSPTRSATSGVGTCVALRITSALRGAAARRARCRRCRARKRPVGEGGAELTPDLATAMPEESSDGLTRPSG